MSDFSKLDEIVEKCPYETKLAITRWVFQNLSKHMNEGGSYRYLVYTRMGFKEDAYAPLYDGGLEISNFCNDAKDFNDGRHD